jgi:exodeoxyribonuclease VII large subunit
MRENIIMLRKRLRDPKKRIADLWLRLDELNIRVVRIGELMISSRKILLSAEQRALLSNSPEKKMQSLERTLIFNRHVLEHVVFKVLKERGLGLDLLKEKMKALNPYSILERGYSITMKMPEKKTLRSVSGLEAGGKVRVILHDGELDCRIESIQQKILK